MFYAPSPNKEKAFNEGKYWKILECLIFGFENPDYEFSSLADAFEMLDLFKRKGFLDNKHNLNIFKIDQTRTYVR